MKADRVLPFRFVAAARAVPQWEDIIELPMLAALEGAEKLHGKTILLVDVSGSMDGTVSEKSDLTRLDAACALTILAREIGEDVEVITFSEQVVLVPPRRGFALRDAIIGSQQHGGTALGAAVAAVNERPHDRLIVFTDEQSRDRVPAAVAAKAYMINVAANKNGVGYGRWTHLDGFSEAVLRFIQEHEAP